MAKTEHVYLQGKAKWCRVYTPSKWDTYYTYLYPTPESLEKIKELKIKNHIKKDEDGYYVLFKRPTSKLIRGKVVAFEPPFVVDSNGQLIRDVPVGNGSDITVKLDYYSYRTPTGSNEHAVRLSGIRIDHLVPFNRQDQTDTEAELTSDTLDQPEQKVKPF